jgi:2-methylcitrate dehydratase PrpD
VEPLTVRLADAVSAQYQAGLPARILDKGRDLLLNTAAVAIAGRHHPGWKQLSSGWPPHRGAGQVALLFTAAANVHDVDDGHIGTLVHPSCVNMGAALGVASLAGVTGRDFLTAFLLGCETEIRFARALSPGALERGWDLNGVCGPLSAAVTAALLLGAGPAMLGNAVGIAASSTLGHLGSAGSLLTSFVAGKASANGVAAALLSRRGFTASPTALDSPRGLGAALVQRPDVFSTVTGALGTQWLLDEVVIERRPWCPVASARGEPAPGGAAGKARDVLRGQRDDGVAESLITFLSAIDEQPDVRSLMTATCG